ncbi:hypothetical protein AMJ44_14935 [candidate division WOR-1 bacterium DG_54_3]|uniref:Uncharacterized protein n=1 Tax=candidate division WOR-1 bacterium DG_54_3 TaxID=1703775 RepID=A0A0S7XL12_UNCSA|nr:MAG: hypothetical protein AMJ44_14935 [candidate division WOR-1 bacterium DG_54_3]
MFKKSLFLALLTFITLIAWKRDSNAKTWERYNTTVSADSILAAIERGEDIKIDSCEIFGAFKKWGTKERPDTIKNFISISNSAFFHSVSFKYCYFMAEVRFFASTFGRMSFYEATFTKHADFSFTTFAIEADFWHTTFGEKIDLSLIEFEDIYLSWKQLDGHLICDVLTSYMLMRYFEENREFDNTDGFYLYMKDQERMQKSPWVRYPEY